MPAVDKEHPSIVRVKGGRVKSVDTCTKVMIGILPFYAHQTYTRVEDVVCNRSITPGGGGTTQEFKLGELPDTLWEAFTADQIDLEHLRGLFPGHLIIAEE